MAAHAIRTATVTGVLAEVAFAVTERGARPKVALGASGKKNARTVG